MKPTLVVALIVAAAALSGCFLRRTVASFTDGPKVEVRASHNGDVDMSVSVGPGSVVTSGDSGPTIVASGPMDTSNREVSSFHGISAGSVVELDFQIGPTSSVQVSAQKDVLPHVRTVVEDGVLKIDLDSGRFQDVKSIKVTVTNPDLDFLEISAAAKGIARGINEEAMRVMVSGTGYLDLEGTAKTLTTEVSGAAKLVANVQATARLKGDVSGNSTVQLKGTFGDTDIEVSGSGSLDLDNLQAQKLDLNVSGSSTVRLSGNVDAARVDGEGAINADLKSLHTQTCDVQASGSSQVSLDVAKSLSAQASGAAAVTYQGNPQVRSDVSGAGSVSKGP
jgi:hypothetical protein